MAQSGGSTPTAVVGAVAREETDGPARLIGVIGLGAIGKALARPWVVAGHQVLIGSRDPAGRQAETAALGQARCVTPAAAVAGSDVVALCVPHTGLDEILRLDVDWTGKVIIDATNPVALSPEGRLVSGLPVPGTVGEALARRLPTASVVRAFTHVMDEVLVSRGIRHPSVWAVAIAGDDEPAKQVVGGLVRDTGFVPVDLGGLADSAPLDPGGLLFPSAFTAADMRVRLAEYKACRCRPDASATARGGVS